MTATKPRQSRAMYDERTSNLAGETAGCKVARVGHCRAGRARWSSAVLALRRGTPRALISRRCALVVVMGR